MEPDPPEEVGGSGRDGDVKPSPDETIRKVIDESVIPRIANQKVYLAMSVADPVPIARADLIYLWDEYHNEYLDFASLGHPVGHLHPIVTRATAEHTRYYGHTAPQGRHVLRWPVQYAKDLSEQFTGQGETPRQVLFTEGEREAVLVGLDLACRNSPLELSDFIQVGGNYGGWTRPHFYYPPEFDPADAQWGRAGALLLNMADNQAQTMRPGVARRWMLAARAAGVPVIVDETVTGFGRLGRMWGFQSTGLSPELIVLGGAAGGGYPLGAVVAAPEVFSGLDLDVSGQAANPISCAAGAATLTTVTIGTLEYMAESGSVLVEGIEGLAGRFGDYIVGHHGYGHLRGIRMIDAEMAERLVEGARQEGLYLSPPVGDTVVLAPVLITSTNELSRGIEILSSVLSGWSSR